MKRLAEEFVGLMGGFDWELDFSEQSVQTLEEVIGRQLEDWRPWRSGKVAKKNLPIASLVGTYLGEVMIRHIGGHWGWMPEFDVAAVQLPSGTLASPPAKAQKRFVNGKEDDLAFLLRGAQVAGLALGLKGHSRTLAQAAPSLQQIARGT